MPHRVILNGKFLAGPTTGVQRVASEMIKALDSIERELQPPNATNIELVIPPSPNVLSLNLTTIPTYKAGYFEGNRWEQFDLPRLAKSRLLVNLANVGPILFSNAITMIHDAQTFSCPTSYSRSFRTWYGLAQPVLGRRNVRILTVSQFSKRELVHYGVAPEEKIDVIYNGVDHLARVQSDRSFATNLRLQPKGFVLSLANTQPHKNIKVLLRAFEDPRLRSVDLVLFGTSTIEELQKINGKAVPSNVKAIGSVSDGFLKGLMEEALTLAFPSKTEGFGLPPLEAMFVGCPTIVAPCGALPEVCGNAAIYADPDDPREWADRILRLAEDSEYWQHKSEAAKVHASKFRWLTSAHQLLDVINLCR